MRRILDRAVKRDLVAVNATVGLSLRRLKHDRDRIATPAEAARLIAALPDDLRALYGDGDVRRTPTRRAARAALVRR